MSASVYLAILIVGMCGAVWHVASQLRRSACARSREKPFDDKYDPDRLMVVAYMRRIDGELEDGKRAP